MQKIKKAHKADHVDLLTVYLCWFEHYLCRIIEPSQRSLGQSLRTHKNGRELHICLPWVHNLLGGETLKVYECDIHKTLYKGEVPSIAAKLEKMKLSTHKTRDRWNNRRKKNQTDWDIRLSKATNLNWRRLYTYSWD